MKNLHTTQSRKSFAFFLESKTWSRVGPPEDFSYSSNYEMNGYEDNIQVDVKTYLIDIAPVASWTLNSLSDALFKVCHDKFDAHPVTYVSNLDLISDALDGCIEALYFCPFQNFTSIESLDECGPLDLFIDSTGQHLSASRVNYMYTKRRK